MNANDHDAASTRTNGDIMRSDPAHSRKAKWLMAAMVVTALLLFLFGLPALKQWIDVGDVNVMIHRMRLVFYGLAIVLFATAAYAGWYARRIFGSLQFPPPGSWVLRDTPLLRGDHARARGWWVLACAVSFALIAVYATILPQQLNRLLALPSAPQPAAIAVPHG